MAIEDKPIGIRLVDGAGYLGKFWSAGDRCAKGWGLDPQEGAEGQSWICACPEKSRFCKAKLLWVDLALKAGREPWTGEYGVAIMMERGSEWEATGLVITFDLGAAGRVRVGARPRAEMTFKELLRIPPEEAERLLLLVRKFGGTVVDPDDPHGAADKDEDDDEAEIEEEAGVSD